MKFRFACEYGSPLHVPAILCMSSLIALTWTSPLHAAPAAAAPAPALSSPPAPAEPGEDELVADFCVRLKRIGTARSVPALAGLLADPAYSTSARYALESIPGPEAGQALIEALDRTTTATRAGIVQSLGQRREAKAAPALSKLLSSSDRLVAGASAVALGRIGTAEAMKALRARLAAKGAEAAPAVLDAMLMGANESLEKGNRAEALAAYELLHKSSYPAHIRNAAYRGMIRSSGKGALALLVSALRENDEPSLLASLQMAHEIDDPAATRELCRLIPQAPVPVQRGLIAALAQRRDPAAAPAVAAALESPDSDTRLAAIRALGTLGDSNGVASLAKTAASGADDEKKAAQQSLLELNGPKVTEALLAQISRGDAAVSMEASRALAGRGDREAIPQLLPLAESGPESVRKAALFALGRLADGSQIHGLTRMVLEARDESSRNLANEALASVCRRLVDSGKPVDPAPIVAGLSSGSAEARTALFQTCSMLADEGVRAALRGAVVGPDEAARSAALRALTESRDAGLMPDLLRLGGESKDASVQAMAIRGYLRLATDPELSKLAPAERIEAIKRILPLVQSVEDKWLVLSKLSGAADLDSLNFALGMIGDPATKNEAIQSALEIAKRSWVNHPAETREAMEKILAASPESKDREAAEGQRRRIDNRNAKRAAAKAAPTPTPEPSSFKPAPDPLSRHSDGIRRVTGGFRREQIDGLFRSEGVGVADFDKDGSLDIATGNLLFYGPDWKIAPMGKGQKEYNPDPGYSNEFLCFPEDLDKDGWLDLIVVGFPNAQTRWMKNPGKRGGEWLESQAIERTGDESPDWLDVDKDGRREMVFTSEKGTAFAQPGKTPTEPWEIRVIAAPEDPKPGHGLGVGDVNGDGRKDVVCPDGWWESPADPKSAPWPFHKVKLSDNPAQMIVFDFDGDGDSDIASSSAHNYGFWWQEQTPSGWTMHEIDKTISQMHALHAADINGDGLPDLVSGKRFWAHRHGDAGTDDPSVLVWFELKRNGGQVEWIRHDIDDNSGVGLHFQIVDLNKDGLLDVVTSNKKGVYAFTQEKK